MKEEFVRFDKIKAILTLKREFEMLKMQESDEDIKTYVIKVIKTVNQI